MKESSTYQAILEEGRSEGQTEGAIAEAKKLLRLQGDAAFGPPDGQTATALDRLDDLAQLEDFSNGYGQRRTGRTCSDICPRAGVAGDGGHREKLKDPAKLSLLHPADGCVFTEPRNHATPDMLNSCRVFVLDWRGRLLALARRNCYNLHSLCRTECLFVWNTKRKSVIASFWKAITGYGSRELRCPLEGVGPCGRWSYLCASHFRPPWHCST